MESSEEHRKAAVKPCKWELCVLGVWKILGRDFLGGLEEKVHRRDSALVSMVFWDVKCLK